MNYLYHKIVIEVPYDKKQAITSYGIIMYCKETKKFLLCQRKHSIEFIFLIKGNYRDVYIPLMMKNITKREYIFLMGLFDLNITEYIDIVKKEFDGEIFDFDYCYMRLHKSKNLICKIGEKLEYLISQNELEWTWPKGRLNYCGQCRESYLQCAIREFEEEIEIEFPKNPTFISKNAISEYTTTIFMKTLCCYFWLVIIENEIEIPFVENNSEVNDRKWMNLDETYQKLQKTTALDYYISNHINKF